MVILRRLKRQGVERQTVEDKGEGKAKRVDLPLDINISQLLASVNCFGRFWNL
jgi:hypothetical protein